MKTALLQLLTSSGRVLFFGKEYLPEAVIAKDGIQQFKTTATGIKISNHSGIGDIFCVELVVEDGEIKATDISGENFPAFVLNTSSTPAQVTHKFKELFKNKVFTITDGNLDELSKKDLDNLFKL